MLVPKHLTTGWMIPKGTNNPLAEVLKHLIINKRQGKPKRQSRMDNPEKLTTQGTQDKDKENNNKKTQYVHKFCNNTTLTNFGFISTHKFISSEQ